MEELESSACVMMAQNPSMAMDADHRPIRFRGKIDAWFYLVALGCNVLASTAASLDRIYIKAHWDETMIAVKDEEAFFAELQKRCSEANITKKIK